MGMWCPQRQRQGRTEDAIGLFEQALALRIDLHGPESSSVRRACESLSDVLNGASLKHLQNEEYEVAKRLLEKAEILTGPEDLITAVTYNNIACYYRRKKKLRTALKYLERAQRIEMKSRHVANPAGTRLNLCAVLSQLERHSEALEHAQAAVVLLQEELSMMSTIDDFGDKNPEALNKMAVLAISYHNIGVVLYCPLRSRCLRALQTSRLSTPLGSFEFMQGVVCPSHTTAVPVPYDAGGRGPNLVRPFGLLVV